MSRGTCPHLLRSALAGGALLLLTACGTGVPDAPSAAPTSPGASPSPQAGPASEEGPSLWNVSMGPGPTPGAADSGAWVRLRHPTYEYELEVPASWTVGVPADFTRSRARLLSPPEAPEVRVVVVPWGIQDRSAEAEIEKTETRWLLADPRLESSMLVGEKRFQVGGRSAIQRQHQAALRDGAGEWRAVATYVAAPPKFYALVLLAPEARADRWQAAYDRMVRTFTARNPEGRGSPSPPEGE